MLKNAINEISEIINFFLDIYKISTHEKDYFTIYYFDKNYKEKSFISASESVKWFEQNLKIAT
mgnify:CR=1 FL=1